MDLTYTITYGTGDGSDSYDWDEPLTDEEEAAYSRGWMFHEVLDDCGALYDAYQRAYDGIVEAENENAADMGFDEDYDVEDYSIDLHICDNADEPVTEEEMKENLRDCFYGKAPYTKVYEYLDFLLDPDTYAEYETDPVAYAQAYAAEKGYAGFQYDRKTDED